jgi:hypothetical protein
MMEWVRWDDGDEMERENEGGWGEWSGVEGEREGEGLGGDVVGWWIVDRG